MDTVAVYALLTWVCSHPPLHPSSVTAELFPGQGRTEKQQQLSLTSRTDTRTQKTLGTTPTPEAMPAEQRKHRFHTTGETGFTSTVQPRQETSKHTASLDEREEAVSRHHF